MVQAVPDHADTVYALSSGHGRCGVAVVRVSGPAAGRALDAIADGRPEPRRASVRTLVDPVTCLEIDHGLILWFPGPQSVTGEDVAEFHVHGGRAVVAALLRALGRVDGLRLAEPGEFTRRAFFHGKLDLTEVEGLADLIEAETEAQRRQALRQVGGALRELYDGWARELTTIMARIEAGIDFADEADVPDDVSSGLADRLRDLSVRIARHLDDGARGERLRDGLRVVIAGEPNVGKSSLLNMMAQRDVAIVSETAGTTRDVIEVHLDLRGNPVTLVDTAGIRDSEEEVERLGIERARQRIASADLVVWVSAPDVICGEGTGVLDTDADVLRIVNKCDLIGDRREFTTSLPPERWLLVSARTGEGVDDLVDVLTRRAEEAFSQSEEPLITRERYRSALEECRTLIGKALDADWHNLELVAEDLRLAARAIGRITGRVDAEHLLDVIFREFCIGK